MELEETLWQAHKIDEAFYQEILHDWAVNVLALKYIGDSYPWERLIDIEERRLDIEARLPDVSEEDFEDYIVLWDLSGILYLEVCP